MGIAFGHGPSVSPRNPLPCPRPRLTARPVCRPLDPCHDFVGPGSPPRSPRPRSGSPTASRSPTGAGPATRARGRHRIDPGRPRPAVRGCRRALARACGLPAWFIPARGGEPGPGVVLVHGWESARDRTLPIALFLHAAGFHCLTFDVRGHGANPPETLPLSAGEFGADALAAFHALIDRPEVTVGAIAGHSMGAIGAILAAAADPRVARRRRDVRSGRSVPPHPPDVPPRPPADPGPDRLSARLADDARLPPAARPPRRRGQRVAGARRSRRTPARSCSIHGDGRRRRAAGPSRAARCAAARARRARRSSRWSSTGGQHSWLYEFDAYRRTVAAFLARALGGPLHAGRGRASARPRCPRCASPTASSGFAAVEREPGGLRTLAQVALPGASPAAPDAGRSGSPRRGRLVTATRRPRRRRRGPDRAHDCRSGRRSSTKRVVRRFAERPLDPEHLDRILDAGRRAGSSKNLQRWDVHRLPRPGPPRASSSTVGPWAGHLAGAAVAIALVTPDPARRRRARCRSCSTSARRPRT